MNDVVRIMTYTTDVRFPTAATQRGSGGQGRNLVEGMGNLR